MKIKRFEDLPVWQLARKLTKRIYEVTETGNLGKDYRLKDQLRSSSVSIMSNIAEGFENQSAKQFVRYLYIAKGSGGELRSELYVTLDVGYLSKQIVDSLQQDAEKISKQCRGLINYLEGYENSNNIVREEPGNTFLDIINRYYQYDY